MADLDADVIVIGSGSGGLTAALACAQAGMSVIVFEQHYVAGGWCHSFVKEGFRFSPGVHYIGGLGKGGDTRKIYEGLGVGNDLAFFEMNPDGYEHTQVNGSRFSYSADYSENQERFLERFPHESKGIKSYLSLLKRVMDQFPLIFEVNSFKDAITMPYRTRDIGRYGLLKLQYLLDGFIKDPELKGILSIQCGDQGMRPDQTMFMLHAGVSRHYEHGAYYPKGGGVAIAQALAKGIRSNGGRIKRGHRVDQILVEGTGNKRRAVGIRCGDKTYRSKIVVSNADPEKTFRGLVGVEHVSKKLIRRLDRTRYSSSCLVCFLVVDMDLRAAGMDSGNVWYGDELNVNSLFTRSADPALYDAEEMPALFISSPTLKDPSHFDGKHHTLEVVTFVDHTPFEKFKNLEPDSRDPEYQKLKDKIKKMFLKTLERVIPDISKHIVVCEIGTPATVSHYIGSTNGNVYGTEKCYRQIGPLSYRAKSEIENLYLVGASTSSHGVAGAAMTGVQAAAKILACRWQEIFKDHGQEIKVYSAENWQIEPMDPSFPIRSIPHMEQPGL